MMNYGNLRQKEKRKSLNILIRALLEMPAFSQFDFLIVYSPAYLFLLLISLIPPKKA